MRPGSRALGYPTRTAQRRLDRAKRRHVAKQQKQQHIIGSMFMQQLEQRMARELYLAQPQGTA